MADYIFGLLFFNVKLKEIVMKVLSLEEMKLVSGGTLCSPRRGGKRGCASSKAASSHKGSKRGGASSGHRAASSKGASSGRCASSS